MDPRYYFVLGTRPEIVKLSPVIDAVKREGGDFEIIHSGQHYDWNMDAVFFEELNLPAPTHVLEVGSGSHSNQTGRILEGVERILEPGGNGFVIVEGDTNTTLGAALAASRCPAVSIAHIEAGCRSFNRAMPEEVNRIVVDHISDVLFAATPFDAENLNREGLARRTHLVGSTGIEACLRHTPVAMRRSTLLSRLSVSKDAFALCTFHRSENTAQPRRLRNLFEALGSVAKRMPIVVPVHPRTAAAVSRLGLEWPSGLIRCPPLGYTDFLAALSNAKLVLTDSGGVQEEAAVLGTRCFTLRNETEWRFTVEAGVNTLVGTDPAKIVSEVDQFLERGTRPVKLTPSWPMGRSPSSAILEELERW